MIPVVGECDDSFLNDCRRMQVEHDDVRAAYAAALDVARSRRPASGGRVGAGTGMSCLGFKGGIGTSSRVTPGGHTVAVLLLTNFGERKRLTVDGVPSGGCCPRTSGRRQRPAGSCIGVVVTDAPVTAPTAPGWPGGSGSGWPAPGRPPTTAAARSSWRSSTTARRPDAGREAGAVVAGRALDDLFEAVVDAARRRCSTRC